MSAESNIVREILDNLDSNSVTGLKKREILYRLGNIDVKFFNAIFSKLVDDGRIKKNAKGNYVSSTSRTTGTGIFNRNPRGFGFIKQDSNQVDIFVPAEYTEEAMSGDKVEYKVFQDNRGPFAKITRILEKKRNDFVGCLVEYHGCYAVRPMKRDLPELLPLFQNNDSPELNGALPGDWVHAAFLPRTDSREPLRVTIVQRIGHANSVVGDLKAICKEYGLPSPYNKNTEEHASTIAPLEIQRLDCRELEVFTVDPIDARDFDDGISITDTDDSNVKEIGVHIADVACYVQHNSPLDRAARKRGFTSYLPGRTVGMLPKALSTGQCSLNQDEEKLAHSVFLKVDIRTGAVVSTSRCHTLIKSRKRLCFEQVDRLLDGEQLSDVEESIAEKVRQVCKITELMRELRAKTEEFLPFDGTEIRVICTGTPLEATELCKTVPGPASQMIEELMLAANVAVATEMSCRHLPALYRNHQPPTKEALDIVAEQAQIIIGTKRKTNLSSRTALVDFLKKIRKIPGGDILNISLLRCMTRADYSTANLGHFGLGKSIYCHFTSPIRRYPDLLVHQQLLAADTEQKLIEASFLQELQLACNALEVNNDQASFAMTDRLKLRLIEQALKNNPHSCIECTVTRVVPAGMSLYISEYGLMAFMPIEMLHGRKWYFDSRENTITDGHSSYKIGSCIFAKPASIDTIQNEIIMKPVPVR